jgi:zinc protease
MEGIRMTSNDGPVTWKTAAAALSLALVSSLSSASAFGAELAPAWAHAHSDLTPDPAVRFGTLANGMRFAILKNATPAGETSIRLRIGSGSLRESDAQQGLAHFLEHMAFRGSTHVPDGEMVKILQRNGLTFGPDVNARTGYAQTIYMLDLPKTDAGRLDAGLMLMREIASELTLSEEAMERERGVVLSEERQSDTPQRRVQLAGLSMMLDGQLAASRAPIGLTEVLKTAPVSLMRDYYHANYRPERAALIIVGDVDPADMEARIKARFADWTPSGPAQSEPDLGSVKPRGPVFKTVEQPGSAAQLQLSWLRPFDDKPDTAAERRGATLRSLVGAVLNQRYAKLARSENPPFLSAGARRENLLLSANYTMIGVNFAPGGWRAALAAAELEQRRLALHGVTREEFDREIVKARTRMQTLAASAATRRTPDLASTLIKSIDDDFVFTAPADDMALFDKIAGDLTLADANAAARQLFEGEGPAVFMATPAAPDGGDASLEAEYAKVHAAPAEAPAAETAIVWPYASFGAPGAVAEHQKIDDLGVTFVRFANNTRLTVKQTRFRENQILVKVRVGNGRLDLPRDRPVAWMTSAFVDGGLKALKVEDLNRALASKIYSLSFGVGDGAFVFDGRTRPQDLDVQMQAVAAYVTDPAFRPEAFERARTAAITALPQQDATASRVHGRDTAALLRSGDARWGSPDLKTLEAAKPQDLKALLEGPLARGQIEVVIVGDVTPETAIQLTAATFGALPARQPEEAPAEVRNVHFPAPAAQPVERAHKGRADDAIAFIAWPTADFFADPRLSATLNLASLIFKNRLIEQFRAAEGATYSPQAAHEQAMHFPGYGYLWSRVETSPSQVPGFYALVSRIAAAMRTDGVSEDELVRTRRPVIEGVKKQQLSNEYWLNWLSELQTEPRRLEALRSQIARYEAVTADDIKRAAALHLTGERAWKMVVSSPSGAGAPESAPVSR